MAASLLISNKKAIKLALSETVVLVIAAILVLASFGVLWKLYGAIVSEKDDGSLANFERLYATIKEISESNEKNYAVINYYLGKDKALIAFDTIWDENKKTSNALSTFSFGETNLYKPYACGNAACICLYDSNIWKPGDKVNRDAGVLGCRSEAFAKKSATFQSAKGPVPQTLGTSRGDNALYAVFKGDSTKEVFRLYIDKKVVGESLTIYLAPIDESNKQDPSTIRIS